MWKSANDLGAIEDRAVGIWSRAEIEEQLEHERRSDSQRRGAEKRERKRLPCGPTDRKRR